MLDALAFLWNNLWLILGVAGVAYVAGHLFPIKKLQRRVG